MNPKAKDIDRADLIEKIKKKKQIRDQYGLSIDLDDNYPDYYLTKLKDEYKGVELSEEEVMANPNKYFEREPYYDI